KANTERGDALEADIYLDNDSRPYKLTYYVNQGSGEAAQISYSYSEDRDGSVLPDIIDKKILSGGDALTAARFSFKVRVTGRQGLGTLINENQYTAAIAQAASATSNGITLVKVRDHFSSAPPKPGARKLSPGQTVSSQNYVNLMTF